MSVGLNHNIYEMIITQGCENAMKTHLKGPVILGMWSADIIAIIIFFLALLNTLVWDPVLFQCHFWWNPQILAREAMTQTGSVLQRDTFLFL